MSFDNAIVNAKILKRMPVLWQQRFLTWGILIAVFGVRLLLPVLMIYFTSELGIIQVIELAIYEPKLYEELLSGGAHKLEIFGGSFLLLVALNFFANSTKNWLWLECIFSLLPRVWQRNLLSGLCFLLVILSLGLYRELALWSATTIFMLLKLLDVVLPKLLQGSKGLSGFLYLEFLDASFSLDGVLAGFAFSNNIIIIALGLAIGAFYVRSFTIYLMDTNIHNRYEYLEHGAFYSILLLSSSMLLKSYISIPSYVLGLVTLVIILSAILSSRKYSETCQD